MITGNITTRKRSTRSAPTRARASDRLPTVRMPGPPFSFCSRTQATASPRTSVVFGMASGSSSVLENTTLGSWAIRSTVASSSSRSPPSGCCWKPRNIS